QALEQVIYSYVPATLEKEEIKKTLASGGYGWSAVAIAGHFTERYWYSQFEPWPDEFIAKFKTNLIYVISDIRRKEQLWSQVYRELDKLLKPLKLKTDTRTSQNYDKTQTLGGRTTTQGQENQSWSDQKQSTAKNIPTFSNLDLSSNTFGGFARQQQLSTQTTEQGQGNRSRDHKNTTDKINHVNKEFYRANKDNNVNITTQDTIEWASVSRILNNFTLTIIDFTQYYKLFDKLMIKMFGVSVVPVIDPITGQRKYIPQHDFEEIREEGAGRPIIPEGNEWDETLSYLERVTIYRNKTEKEYNKMPPTSNRRPRISRRLEVLNGLVKAEEKLSQGEITWATLPEFDAYCSTYIIGYKKFISIMRAQLASQLFYQGTGEKVPQGLYLLLGPPGIGKSYICQELAKAMKRGFHSIDMNGKRNGSIIFGANMENPGADIGEIIKAIGIKTQDPYAFLAFDEYEKSHGAAKSAVGDVTDMTKNKFFKDELVDFPYNLENITFFATGNYEWQVEGFIFSRFTRVEIEILTWAERVEILRRLLFGYREQKGKIQGLEKVLQQKSMLTPEIKTYLDNLNDLTLLKRFLTQNWGIRQSKNNALLLVKMLNGFFAEGKELPADPLNYDWGFTYSTEKGELCSELHQQETRPTNCQCWDATQVEGWEENMNNE
ncbi:MAG: ATP-dependent protease LA, partial [Mycoplasmataceae bacterium RV_VA103A]